MQTEKSVYEEVEKLMGEVEPPRVALVERREDSVHRGGPHGLWGERSGRSPFGGAAFRFGNIGAGVGA